MTTDKTKDTSVLHFGNIEQLAQTKYLDYAMSVITSRALPDVRDGLKPVQRRILYSMHMLKSSSTGVYKKSARIVGDVIGKYHPHGDSSVYDAMVRLAQPFSMRVMLVDGQGNFGSVDGDAAAAQRYCFSGDTRIMTEKGLIQIKDFPNIVGKKGEIIDLDMQVNSLTKQETAVKWLFSGVQDAVSVVTNKGYTTTCTANEPLYVLDKNLDYKWKNVEDLQLGDFIAMNTKNSVVVSPNKALKNDNPAFPQFMSRDFAKFLGYLLSDGSMRMDGTTVEFGSSAKEIYDDYKNLVVSLFPQQKIHERVLPVTTGRQIDSTKEHFYLCINSTALVKFLSGIGITPCYARDKVVPEVIFQASLEEVASFISGYYEGDGGFCKNARGQSLYLSSTSTKMLEQMKQLLLNYFGIISNQIRLDKSYEDKSCYRMEIYNSEDILTFKDKIGFISAKKRAAIELCLTVDEKSVGFKKNYIPNLSQYLTGYFQDISAKYMLNEAGQKIFKQDVFKGMSLVKFKRVKTAFKLKVYLSRWSDEAKSNFPNLYRKLSDLLSREYYYDSIKSIAKLEEKIPVYDLTVNNTHAFVANGFIAHNTETRFHRFSEMMFEDIDLKTVDMQDNYDGTETEPTVLPLSYPNLLINGVQGIAVGMASNIPPHNPIEVMQAVKYMVGCMQNSTAPLLEDLIKIIPAPDFPTKGVVHGTASMREAWTKGRGKMKLRSQWREEVVDGRTVIVVYEIPYQVNKERLKGRLKELSLPVADKNHALFGVPEVDGIYDVTDESDKNGTRLCIYLKNGFEPEVIFNQLLKMTELETSISYNATVIVRGEPKVLGLQDILEQFILHRDEVIQRRTATLYEKNLAKEVILVALMRAVHPDNLDKVIHIVRSNKEVKDAKEQLMTLLDLTDAQGSAVLELSLKKLTGLEIDSMQTDLDVRKLENIEYRKILAEPQRRFEIIQEEADNQIKLFSSTKEDLDKYWTHLPYAKRLTSYQEDLIKTDLGSLTKEEDSVLLYTNEGYIRRCPITDFKEQRRGTQGNKKFDLHKNDFIVNTIDAHSHDTIAFITEKGQAFTVKAYEIGTSLSGRHINNLLGNKNADDKIAKIMPIDFDSNAELTLITQQGMVKRGAVKDYKTASVYKSGIRIMKISETDRIYDAHITTSDNDLMFFKSDNTVSRTDIESFNIKKGRVTTGVAGTKLTSDLIGVVSVDKSDEKGIVATITDNALIKLSYVSEYRSTARKSKGVKAFKESERSGNLVKAVYLEDLNNDIVVVTQKGLVNRIGLDTFRVSSRVSTGFKLIELSKTDAIVSVFVVKSLDEE